MIQIKKTMSGLQNHSGNLTKTFLYSFMLVINVFSCGYFIKTTLKFICTFVVISLNSLLLCIFLNYLIQIPSSEQISLKFTFSDDKQSLYSSVIHCSYFSTTEENCARVADARYSISILLEIANQLDVQLEENIEVEIAVHTKSKTQNVSRLFYFEKNEAYAERAQKLLLLPFRLFNYYTTRSVKVYLLKSYDNTRSPLIKIEIWIKKPNLSISNCYLLLNPVNGLFLTMLSMLKIVLFPMIFLWLILLQYAFYSVLFFLNFILQFA